MSHDEPTLLDCIISLAGGLATGADDTKSEEERITYGGIANAILDPCYHQVRKVIVNTETRRPPRSTIIPAM